MVDGPGLPLVDPGLSRCQQCRRGADQLTELRDQQRHQLHGRQHQQAHGEQHHHGDGTDAREASPHQPAAGQVEQKRDQGRRQEQTGERCELHQHPFEHKGVHPQQRQHQSETQPGRPGGHRVEVQGVDMPSR